LEAQQVFQVPDRAVISATMVEYDGMRLRSYAPTFQFSKRHEKVITNGYRRWEIDETDGRKTVAVISLISSKNLIPNRKESSKVLVAMPFEI